MAIFLSWTDLSHLRTHGRQIWAYFYYYVWDATNSSANTAKECLTTKDHIFQSRPKNLLAEIMGYNYAMFGIGPSGPYWRQSRKLMTLQLLTNRKVEIFGRVREIELKNSLKEIYSSWMINRNGNMEMKQWFRRLSLNTIKPSAW